MTTNQEIVYGKEIKCEDCYYWYDGKCQHSLDPKVRPCGHWIMKKMFHKYGMRVRGFSPGCQPRMGIIDRVDDTTGKYYDCIVYCRKLTENECREYDLDYLGEIDGGHYAD